MHLPTEGAEMVPLMGMDVNENPLMPNVYGDDSDDIHAKAKDLGLRRHLLATILTPVSHQHGSTCDKLGICSRIFETQDFSQSTDAFQLFFGVTHIYCSIVVRQSYDNTKTCGLKASCSC
ncbi:hypothetical protein RSOLAG1IB_00567 [Rhizoctonia solani AG-1 IB]|uniref:Uncharacterized protein n=1 Tax=Thanatephorus cucumeris (strain AG1-IB / isolate 7/3/14) TaxID=1108050 RepID=A0A0B7F3D0_THACB|nr:hypothetical protein RSOLAG1IB_00567 [Rhizoctonia solani AG-1 IB]